MKRIIVIGDVHGCSRELGLLLDLVAPTRDDRVRFVGDLVAKGPDTSGVLALVRQAGGVSVLGNHEQRLLDVRAARAQGRPAPRLGPAHERAMAQLSAEDWFDLERMPPFIDEPGLRVVHGGVVPGVPIGEQDVRVLSSMRSLDHQGCPSDRWSPTPWGASYSGPPHVVFGHDARSGLQLWPDATGLDTGCVYGGKLSALVVVEGEPVPAASERAARIVSVPAFGPYADPP